MITPLLQIVLHGTALTGTSTAVDQPEPGTLRFAAPNATIDFGPEARLGVASTESFTVELSLRTNQAEFATPLMCREGDAVHYSLVLGRTPGTVSFEVWSWANDRCRSTTQVNDGQWHRVVASYLAAERLLALWVDDRLEAFIETGQSFQKTPNPMLRLGNNLCGAVQPFRGDLKDVVVRAGDGPAAAALAAVGSSAAALAVAYRVGRVLAPNQARTALETWLAHQRRPREPKASTPEDWSAQAARMRAQVQDALGLWPPPYAGAGIPSTWPSPLHAQGTELRATDFVRYRPTLPLDVRSGGTLARDGYTVTRVDWQSVVGHRALGVLYQPRAPAAGKRPAVLCPHGHWANGNQHPVVQSRCITLAKLGYVVLTVDSEHVDDDPIGLSPAGLMTWNNLRGLELLRAQPDVDPARIACTGASGGALQTMHLMALDTGLAAAAPAVMACHFEEILLAHGVHCHCNFTPRLCTVGDQPQMCAVFAPRPLFFLSVTGDWTHRFPTHGFPGVQAIYQLLGAPDQVRQRQWEGGHDFNRPMRNAVYAFLAQALLGTQAPGAEAKTPVAEAETTEPATETVATLAGLDRPGVERDPRAVAREFRARLLAAPLGAVQVVGAAGTQRLATLRTRLADLFGEIQGTATVAEQDLRRWQERPCRTALVHCPSDPQQVGVPVLVVGAAAAAAQRVTVLVGAPKVRLLAERSPWLLDALARGEAVVLADVRYTGELDQGQEWRDPYGKFFGADEGILAVQDIRRVLDALPQLLGQTPAATTLIGLGTHGAAALYAAALDARITALVVPELGACYRDQDRRPKVARVLRHGDLPDAAVLVAPRRLTAGGVTDPKAFAAAVARFATLDAAGQLMLRRERLPEPGPR